MKLSIYLQFVIFATPTTISDKECATSQLTEDDTALNAGSFITNGTRGLIFLLSAW